MQEKNNNINNLTVTIDNTVFELSREFREMIEQRVNVEYGENSFLEYYWTEENNNPVIKIETEGKKAPWEKISEFEVQKETKNDSQESNEHYEIMFPESFRPFLDPEDNNPDTLPPQPEEFDSRKHDETLVIPIPENKRNERWSAGTTIIPVYSTITWDIQKRINTTTHYHESTPSNPTNSIQSDPNNKKLWKKICKYYNCNKIKTIPQNDSNNDILNKYKDTTDTGPKYSNSTQNFTI